jgi:M6 family metalloprotease-like protein
VPGTITREQVEDFCNTPGYTGFGNRGSVRDYFLEVSVGRLKYRNIVAPYYTARHPRAYYTNESIPQPQRARALIKEALAFHKSNGFDFSALTVDSQQFVYATNVFYAGTRVNNWAKGLWPHAYHLQNPVALAPGKKAFDYQITDMTDELTLGTFCHENGHMVCDFPDLYDYGNESAGVGAFCLMCAGANIDEKNPPHVGAYLKFKAGWSQRVTVIAAGLAATATAGSNEFFLFRKNPSEYYIIENRFKQGRDSALPGSGLAIWRIDELGDNQHEQMTASSHYECSLVQADGRHDLENDPQNLGDASDLFAKGINDRFNGVTLPGSSWWDGSASGLDISAISPAGPTMTFTGSA